MLGVAGARREEKPRIHLYASAADYRAIENELTHGAFKDNLCFTHWDSSAAHILFQPSSSKKVLTKTGLPIQTRHVVAHEAFHLACNALAPNYKRLPDWLGDGAASYAEDVVLRRHKWSAGRGLHPFTSTYLHHAQQLLREGKLPEIRDIVRGELKSFDPSTQYGLRWLLFCFLEEGPKPGSGRRLMRDVLELIEKHESEPATLTEAIQSRYDEFAGLNKEFGEFINEFKPKWDEVYRSLDTSGERWPQIAFPEKNAIAWRTSPIRHEAYAVSGRLEILPGEKEQLQLLLARSHQGFISVAFIAGYGVTAFHFRSANQEWERLGSAETSKVALNQDFSFRVTVDNGEIRIEVDAEPVFSAKLDKKYTRGPWGIGAQAGAAGIWSKLRVQRVGKPPEGK